MILRYLQYKIGKSVKLPKGINFVQSSIGKKGGSTSLAEFMDVDITVRITLREKYPNAEFVLAPIFQ